MAHYYQIRDAIQDRIMGLANGPAGAAAENAAAEWRGSAREDNNQYASEVLERTDMLPNDAPLTAEQDAVIQEIAARLVAERAAWEAEQVEAE